MANIDLSEHIAHWACGLDYEAIPQQVVLNAKMALLDTLAVAYAGRCASGVAPVLDMVRVQGGVPQSRLWGSTTKVPPISAAFANGLLAAALDYDCVHAHTGAHADIVIAPALLALAGKAPLPGRKFLAAYIAGREIMVRLVTAMEENPGWYLSSVFGVFASSLSCALAMGLPAHRVQAALGIALSRAAGSRQPLLEGSATKRLQTAWAARDGLEAALLAEAGVSAPRSTMQGNAGVEALYGRLDRRCMQSELGGRYLSMDFTYKQYPSCLCNQAGIIAALQLRERHMIRPEDIAQCTVTVTPYAAYLVGSPFLPGDDPQVAAQFNIRYCLARALCRGEFGIEDISVEATKDPATHSIVARTEVVIDATQQGKFAPLALSIRLHDGRLFEHTVHELAGTPGAPLSDQQLHNKVKDCLLRATPASSQVPASTLIKRVHALEHARHVDDDYFLTS